MYFSDLSEFYFNMIQTRNNSERIEKDRRLLEQFVIPFVMRKEIPAITSDDIKVALTQIETASSTSNRVYLHRLLINIFRLAVDTALLDDNPADFPDKEIRKPHTPRNIRIYSQDEMNRIYEAIRHNYLKNAFAMSISCGLSHKAILDLKISDYHRDEGTLDIPLQDGSTNRIMLGTSHIWFLDQEVKRQMWMEHLRGTGAKPATYLFGDYRGEQLSLRTLERNVVLIRKASGIPDFSITGLCRYYIFQSVRYGADPISVLQSVGLSTSTKYHYLLTIPDASSNYPSQFIGDLIGGALS